MAEATPATDLPTEGKLLFLGEINKFMRLAGGGWPPEQRQEWQDQAAEELAVYPVLLTVPAIREARQRIFSPARFVPWVIEAIADGHARLDREMAQLGQLNAIAGGAATAGGKSR